MAYKIKRKVAKGYIPLSDKLEKQLDKYAKKSYYNSLKPEKKEKAYLFLNANYSNDELDEMSDEQAEKILKENKKEWDY